MDFQVTVNKQTIEVFSVSDVESAEAAIDAVRAGDLSPQSSGTLSVQYIPQSVVRQDPKE